VTKKNRVEIQGFLLLVYVQHLQLNSLVNMNFQAIWLKVSSEFAPVFHAFNRKIGVEGQLKKTVFVFKS